MKNVVLISASPKVGQKSVSDFCIKMAEKLIDGDGLRKRIVNVRESITHYKTLQDFEAMAEADAIIIAFPLYVFCMPGMLTRFLEDYYSFHIERKKTENGAKVYAIINCGFPEPEINREAAMVIKSFCRHINAQYRFSVLIGGGGMMLHAKDAPFMKKTLASLNNAFSEIIRDARDSRCSGRNSICIKMNFPRRLYFFMAHMDWVRSARKNGLKKKDLYRAPYVLPPEQP